MDWKPEVLEQFDNCPFCNSDDVDVFYYDPYDGMQGNNWRYQGKCNSCGAMMERKTLEALEAAWNRRDCIPRRVRRCKCLLDNLQKELIILLAQNDLNVAAVERKCSRMSRKWIDAEIAKIKRNTNLNPRNFFDLYDLYQLAVSEVSK